MSPKTKRRLLLAVLSPLVTAVLAEAYFRSRVPECGVTPFRTSERSGLAAELRPGFETLYKGQEVRINSSGYRGGEIPEPEPGKRRIALVGDSFVFGNAVPWEDTLGVCLESELEDTQILNFGVPGYNATNVAAVVEHDTLKHFPDTVVYVFYNNDIHATPNFSEIKPDDTIDAMYGYPMGSATLQWMLVTTRVVALDVFDVQLARRTPERSAELWELEGRERVETAIRKMRALCEERGITYKVAVFPYLTDRNHNPFAPIDESVIELCQELGIECWHVLEAFGDEVDLRQYWVSKFDKHPRGKANRIVAKWMAELLRGAH